MSNNNNSSSKDATTKVKKKPRKITKVKTEDSSLSELMKGLDTTPGKKW